MKKPSFFARRPVLARVLVTGAIFVVIAVVTAALAIAFRPTKELVIGETTFKVWVADSEAERIQGLSGVERLNADGGLLMEFATDELWGIWMKDMKIPLDIVWLNKDRQIIYIVKSATPELSTNVVFKPTEPARYVLELPAGTVNRVGILTGQLAEFEPSREVR